MKKLILVLSFAILTACSGDIKEINIEGQTMGTYYRIKTYGTEDPAELKAKVDKFLKLFNNIFSTYIKDSEISKINHSKFEHNKVSEPFKKLLEISLDVSKKSYGYFDITVAPLVNAWGFGPDGQLKKPSQEEITKLRMNVGYDKLKIVDDRLHMPVAMSLDMSAVAKGHGVDELVKFLEYDGYKHLLVEIGGEVRARGSKLDGSYWRVGIEGPGKALGSKISKVISLKNMAMATSGSYRNFVKYGDEVFNHTIDPLSGMPVRHKTISVSVVHEFCTDADAWATAFMSMGVIKGLDLANKYNLMAYFQVKEDDKIKIYTSTAFDKYIKRFKK